MRRRDFLRNMLPMGLAPFALNGIPLRALSQTMMPAGFSCSDIQDRALVIVQLHGGNDGLNTFLPVDQYSLYRNYRPIIGIPDTGPRSYINLDTTLPVADQVGLNPDLGAFKALYDQGKARVIQQVSYPSNNGSHFRGTDIWLTGNDGNTMPEHPSSGWWGRYLNHWYPNYPDAYPNTDMMDPPGLEFGSHIVSLGFHREVGIPMGLTLSNDPSGFYNLVSGLGGALPENFPASDYGDELRYIVEIERSTNVYAQRLSDVFALGGNTVTYPDTYHTNAASHYRNPLSAQLRTVARLLSGGSRTKIFLVRMGGFDTHANQGIPDKPSFGGHSALLYHLSQALKAFQDDLQGLGIEDRVMTVTFSEFGRQVAENGTFGTDHGTSAPMMVIGKGVNPGVSGTNPNLSSLSNNNLTGYQHDYRQVFTTLLQDWLGANNGTLDEVGFYPFSGQKLPLVNTQYVDTSGTTVDYTADPTCDQTPDLPALKVDAGLSRRTELQVFPNPARETASLTLTWDRMQPATLLLADIAGHAVRTQEIRLYAGTQTVELDITGLSAGTYVILLTLPHAGKRPIGSTKLVIL